MKGTIQSFVPFMALFYCLLNKRSHGFILYWIQQILWAALPGRALLLGRVRSWATLGRRSSRKQADLGLGPWWSQELGPRIQLSLRASPLPITSLLPGPHHR